MFYTLCLEHTYPRKPPEEDYSDHAITRLIANLMCDLMSDLVICKFTKSMVIHDTECPY